MTSLCYKCSQRKAVVDAKLRARSGSSDPFDPETMRFEAYLYQQNPLCPRCDVVLQSRAETKHVTRHVTSHVQSKAGTLALIAAILILISVLILICIFHESVIAGLNAVISTLSTVTPTLPSSITTLRDVIRYARDVISSAGDVITSAGDVISQTLEGVVGCDELVYSLVFVFQIGTVILRQYSLTSLLLIFISFTLYKLSSFVPEGYLIYNTVVRYSFLAISVLQLFTKKTTVVTVSQRKSTKKPVIKVRRSPRKRESSPSLQKSALFSDDEECLHGHLKSNNETDDLAALFISSANHSAVFALRDKSLANQKAVFDCQPPGTPVKEVSNKLHIMRISSSPVKSPKLIPVPTVTPNKRHSGCLKPASFSLDRLTAVPTDPVNPEPDPLESVRRRFDSAGSDSDELEVSSPVVVNNVVGNDTLPLKPIILVLVISVVTNYYLLVNYVLVS